MPMSSQHESIKWKSKRRKPRKLSCNKLPERMFSTVLIFVMVGFIIATHLQPTSNNDGMDLDVFSLLDPSHESDGMSYRTSLKISQNDGMLHESKDFDDAIMVSINGHVDGESIVSESIQQYGIPKEDDEMMESKIDDDLSTSSDTLNEKLQRGEHRSNSIYSPVLNDAQIILEPSLGQHRPNADAIFGIADGYELEKFLLLVESLRETGFKGDVVLGVSRFEKLLIGVEEYLRKNQVEDDSEELNVVVYSINWKCYNKKGSTAGARGGRNMCELVGMYGNGTDNQPIKDPREPRPISTARYELYWAWSQYYNKENWIMLSDTRDVYFQSNPFANLNKERRRRKTNDNIDDSGGLLYFFAEPGNLNESFVNKRWLLNTYVDNPTLRSVLKKPILCSGSTMGQVVALEPYIQAMIHEHDKTKSKLKGCDQAFHNYLFYTDALSKLKGIGEVVVFEQGKGMINNVGMLCRDKKSFREWGILNDKNEVLNWDGSISAVVHQYDRDDEMKKHLNEKVKKWI